MTLQDFQVWSAYILKPRKGIKRFTLEDFSARGRRAVGGRSRMATGVGSIRGMEDGDEDEEEEEEEPQPVAPRRKKIASKRVRAGKSTRERNN